MMRIRTLAQMGREEEALELGEQIRAFIHQVGGEDGMMMKYLERGINNVKQGFIAPKCNIRKTTVASSAAMNVTRLTISVVAV